MRSFIVLCLIALATADKLGYDYQPVGHADSSFGRGESVLSGQIGGGAGGFGGFGAASNQAGSFSAGGAGGSQGGFGGAGGSQGGFGGAGGAGGSFSAGGDGGFGGVGAASNQAGSFSAGSDGGSFGGVADGGVDKEFYTFSADEGEFDQPEASEQIANSLKQNLQVVFIKGPENKGLENAALNLAKHAGEQKTAIYVLSKQADIGDLANKLNAQNSHNQQKPEVHFVKYRTQEDAQHAQHAIQSQYDQLGGSSQSHNGGVAPVLDFASRGQIGGGHHAGGHNGGHAGSASAPGATYLPANFVRL